VFGCIAPQTRTTERTAFQELAQLGRRLELRDGLQFLERRCEGIGQAPDCPRTELLVPRREVQIVHRASKVLGSFELALNERLVDDNLGSDIRQLSSLPGLHLFLHGFEVALHPVHTHRDAID
jgi:hypothetical protein